MKDCLIVCFPYVEPGPGVLVVLPDTLVQPTLHVCFLHRRTKTLFLVFAKVFLRRFDWQNTQRMQFKHS
jgi:hypothetical protein